MGIRLRASTGSIVEASERNAERLVRENGYKYLPEEPGPAGDVSEPVVVPKRRGRPPKKKETND